MSRCGDDGIWKFERRCAAVCEHGGCREPNSCTNIALCPSGVSCCQADMVPGGKFALQFVYGERVGEEVQLMPGMVERRVPAFALDRFEVTVSRFRSFVGGYSNADRKPKHGDATYLEIPGSGWHEDWNKNPAFLPHFQIDLEDALRRSDQSIFDAEADPHLPVRGVNWFTALAFCIWDGARLPTEGEWSFAAVGGSRMRVYPWDDPDLKPSIGSEHAQFDSEQPVAVGSKPAGHGEWGHEDLAGNLAEWVFDGYRDQPEPAPCAGEVGADAGNRWACVELHPVKGSERVLRGGSYNNNSAILQNVQRTAAPADWGDPRIGFRCARSLDGGE